MATGSVGKLTMQLQNYFDRLAPNWDEEACSEKLECLRNIVKELNIKPGNWVLDIGSGTGILLPFLIAAVEEKGKVIALDFSQKMLHQARCKEFQHAVYFVQADAVAIPLSDNCIDLAICNNVFPHFNDKEKALKEIARVIKNDGRLVICHTMSREAVNQLHQSIGGMVANDLLPSTSQLIGLIRQVGLRIIFFEDSLERYLIIAEKEIETSYSL